MADPNITTQVNQFVSEFMTKHGSLINSVSRKYLIPNRYNSDDIKQYVTERIIVILTNRLSSKDNQIENPEKYFKSCLDYYCIEYQRMHGYIFDLPKRPRKNCLDEEAEIRSMGFKYLDDITTEESNQLQSCYEHEQDNLDAPVNTESVWSYLTGCLTKQEADVIDCIFAKNMTWNETSIYLNVPQSTCWFRKNRAVEKLYNACLTLSGSNIQDNLRDLIRGNVERLFELRENVHD